VVSVQDARDFAKKLELVQSDLKAVQANADAALAKNNPAKQDDTVAHKAEELQGELRKVQHLEQEAKKRMAQMEHALECKDAKIAAMLDDEQATLEEKTALTKKLQSVAPTVLHVPCFVASVESNSSSNSYCMEFETIPRQKAFYKLQSAEALSQKRLG
jgi:seryl-tRNA synthetase